MTLLFIRLFFLIISSFVGMYIGAGNIGALQGSGIGAAAAMALIFLEMGLKRVSVRGLSSMVFGLLLGVFMANLVSNILDLLPLGAFVHAVSRVVLTLIFSYLGAVMAMRGKDEFHLIIPYVRFKRQDLDEKITILDTSAIIDGRIADVYKTGFFNDRMVVPRFVLNELQDLADSNDPVRRQKGRRGLEILRQMQKDPALDIRVHEDDVPAESAVDAKLVRLAKVMDASICTTDFNLNRMAGIQGIPVLNIDELAGALKPAIYTGEEVEVKLVKEGREPNQAVAFSDDGTMIVVNDAKALIGQTVGVKINSVLPTAGGRIIFAKLKE